MNVKPIQTDGIFPKNNNDMDKLKKTAQEFEAIFLRQMIKSMRSAVPKSGLIDGGSGEEIFKSMLDGQWASALSQKGSFGIADSVYKELARVSVQKAKQPAPAEAARPSAKFKKP